MVLVGDGLRDRGDRGGEAIEDMGDVVVRVDGVVARASGTPTHQATGSDLDIPLLAGWRRRGEQPSLPESHSTVSFSSDAPWYKRLFSFAGVGFLISVGYSDPGNWVRFN